MKFTSIFYIAVTATILSSSDVTSFSPVQKICQTNNYFNSKTRLHYRNHHSQDSKDVIVDTATAAASAAAAAASATTNSNARGSIRRPIANNNQGKSKETERKQVILSVKSIRDYQELVANEPEKLVILRFSAPWCRVCKATSIAYERLAEKFHRSYSSGVKFLSVNIDGTTGTNDLKETLNVKQVPMGLIYHPRVGMMGQVKLTRGNLGELKKRLGKFIDGGGKGDDLDLFLEGLIEVDVNGDVDEVDVVKEDAN